MFKLVTPGVGPVWTPGASYGKNNKGPLLDATSQNIQALDLSVSQMKNSEVGLLWSYVPTCAPGAG